MEQKPLFQIDVVHEWQIFSAVDQRSLGQDLLLFLRQSRAALRPRDREIRRARSWLRSVSEVEALDAERRDDSGWREPRRKRRRRRGSWRRMSGSRNALEFLGSVQSIFCELQRNEIFEKIKTRNYLSVEKLLNELARVIPQELRINLETKHAFHTK